MDWQPIATAPKDGSRVVCWRSGMDSPEVLVWKTNGRLIHPDDAAAFNAGKLSAPARSSVEGHDASYFGDPHEMDDYDLARPENFPTHWLDFRPLPA